MPQPRASATRRPALGAAKHLGLALACCCQVLLVLVLQLDSGVGCGPAGGWLQKIRGLGNKLVVAGPTKSFEELLQLEYDALNDRLADEVPLDEPLDNLAKAQEWLDNLDKTQEGAQQQQQQRRQQQQQVGSKRDDSGTNGAHVRREALVRFTSLLELMDEERPQCNSMAYEILRRNERATGTQLMVMPQAGLAGSARRIESVVRQVALGHAELCRHEYPKRLRAALRALDAAAKRQLEDLRRMLDAIIETSQRRIFTTENRHMDRRQVLREKAKGISLARMPEARALLEYLRDRAASYEDPDSRYLTVGSDPKRRGRVLVEEARVHALVQKYGFQRCELLVRDLGGVLGPAAYEQQLSPSDRKYRAINEQSAELLIFLEYYKLCDEMLERHKPTLQRNVVRAIWEEAEMTR